MQGPARGRVQEWEACPQRRTFVSLTCSKVLYSKVILFQSCRNPFLTFWLGCGGFLFICLVFMVVIFFNCSITNLQQDYRQILPALGSIRFKCEMLRRELQPEDCENSKGKTRCWKNK